MEAGRGRGRVGRQVARERSGVSRDGDTAAHVVVARTVLAHCAHRAHDTVGGEYFALRFTCMHRHICMYRLMYRLNCCVTELARGRRSEEVFGGCPRVLG